MSIEINNIRAPSQKQQDNLERSQDRTEFKQAEKRDDKGTEEVRLSEDAISVQRIEARLEESEAFDEVRVEEIKRAISRGEYPIDTDQLAAKFYELEAQLGS